MTVRVGIGYDVHQLVPERDLVLGGVTIPSDKGVLGHSDGDVLTHAIADALLGAANLGDIGEHFPSSDDNIAGISSLEILKKIRQKILNTGYEIGNIDATIVLQEPKIAGYLPQIKANLSEILTIEQSLISIKATTTDHLGFAGRGEGAAAMCVASLRK
ncbi:MAG: 2-C-methyl-D-erythritol 2,4-cyclodiphosphate synthase [Candidatus Marinimicrobia bacterium]|nr:2-C-methyl-D-erythritol 2,4-cyclodiphosphate synthase [Candidatus Neomarinimicrobiota bacterium]MCF7829056.1 2-C-methyl-D-erythritol 2,4-cyclodiphosphate synthase [Candidatus Neomarinimicrobiota bacterium]MCF7881807.1 2-C-methyl-D-erythritol 2,4-cyclodiphosphate synthase [Candidatus Neomarinimicrobiota bacterium]